MRETKIHSNCFLFILYSPDILLRFKRIFFHDVVECECGGQYRFCQRVGSSQLESFPIDQVYPFHSFVSNLECLFEDSALLFLVFHHKVEHNLPADLVIHFNWIF